MYTVHLKSNPSEKFKSDYQRDIFVLACDYTCIKSKKIIQSVADDISEIRAAHNKP
jgi:hypothetical protein